MEVKHPPSLSPISTVEEMVRIETPSVNDDSEIIKDSLFSRMLSLKMTTLMQTLVIPTLNIWSVDSMLL